MQKKWLSVVFLSALLLAACNAAPTSVDNSATPDDTNAEDVFPDEDAAFSADSGEDDSNDLTDGNTEGAARVIEISATNWEFSPSQITMKKGEKITLRIVGAEGTHGFAIPDLGVNVPVATGQSVDVVLPTDTAGTFAFRCSVPCGPGHKDMKGTVVIEE